MAKNKKYLSAEEAAEHLGIEVSELMRARERGELRGFADRGAWKFKVEDVENLGRSRQTDSDPEVNLVDDEFDFDAAIESDSVLGGDEQDEDELSEQRTVISKDRPSVEDDESVFEDPSGEEMSDSDVRLVAGDEAQPKTGSDPDVDLIAEDDSDSDVRIADDSAVGSKSDSDVQLAEESSSGEEGSESDVKLIGAGSDEEGSDSDVQLVAGDSAINLDEDESQPRQDDSVLSDDESGVALGEESGIGLSSESGISLDSPVDSGISLESDDESDDAVSGHDDESGIALDMSEDSGIALFDDESGEHDKTEAVPSAGPSDDEDESQFELGAAESSGDTNVLVFEDEDDEADEQSATMVKSGEAASDEFDLEVEEEFDEAEDDELVAGDLLEEDEDVDVFDAGDEDFDEDFDAGSSADFASPAARSRATVPVESDWGMGVFIPLAISAVFLCVCGMVMFDLVRTMQHDPSGLEAPVAEMIGGLLK